MILLKIIIVEIMPSKTHHFYIQYLNGINFMCTCAIPNRTSPFETILSIWSVYVFIQFIWFTVPSN